ncbi:MAG: exodeoxyribonuclease VII small subunit [Erysipelotrichaceae bacterium]|nr:exodeoxyribonuclease VII small subunit [Erysipelotrichaceae bacterium]
MDKEMTFEQAMKRLEEIAQIIQKNECSLDEGLKLYEEGLKLAGFCDEKLNVFQSRLNELSSKEESKDADK